MESRIYDSQALTVARPFPPLDHIQRSGSPSSTRSILAENPTSYDEQQLWQPILQASNQVVLYNPRLHALSIAPTSNAAATASGVVVARRQRREESLAAAGTASGAAATDRCPYCHQTLPPGFRRFPGHGHGSQDVDGEWDYEYLDSSEEDDETPEVGAVSMDPAIQSRASDYFRLLAIVNQASSRDPSPGSTGYREERRTRASSRSRSTSRVRDQTPNNRSTQGAFPADKMAEGYFKTFFQEEYKLGMGANGSVFLCQHVLDGNPLGHFAVKKIAVGESHSYLLKILREVRLLERLHHPNIITYHHAWLENSQFSSFGPRIPTLHVLMQWAEGGSLDDFIDVRLGRKPAHIHMHPLMTSTTSSIFAASNPASPMSVASELPDDEGGRPTTPTLNRPQMHARFGETSSPNPHAHAPSASKQEDPQSRAARIKAFRAYQKAPPEEKERMKREMESMFSMGLGGPASGAGARRTEWTAVHLLSAQEVHSLFRDVVEGLAFLHDKSILHLDLKPGNVLLTWDEGKLIPRAMLSDFGTSRDMINSSRVQRSGNTGTLEYTAPESLPSPHTGKLQQIDSKADMWSLGMILHKLLFFKLPYRYAAAGDANGEPISRDEEGEKMERLEKEVLEYPGFKSTAALVAGFEARRLPRAFLVLLENLLHKSPAGRPSCERVSIAIKEGKLDPLSDTQSTQSLPLARPRPAEPSPPIEVTTPGGENLDPTTEENARILHAVERSILALPSPIEILGPEEGSWRTWLSWGSWTRYIENGLWATGVIAGGNAKLKRKYSGVKKRERQARRLALYRRTARMALLVAKLLTMDLRQLSGAESLDRMGYWVTLGLLVAAVLDGMVYHDDLGASPGEARAAADGLPLERRRIYPFSKLTRVRRDAWITVGLAALHAFVLRAVQSPHLRSYFTYMSLLVGTYIYLQ
ncbi:kinase-like protein [Agrocybe pediades]|nr:kinase-like protein [Agrocybe pediades]